MVGSREKYGSANRPGIDQQGTDQTFMSSRLPILWDLEAPETELGLLDEEREKHKKR